jgi:hypothetical protein
MMFRAAFLFGALAAGFSGARVAADLVLFEAPVPAIDRWMNPFNTQPGYRPTASVFGSIGVTIPGFNFDDRYSQFLVGYDTAAAIPTGRGPCRYRVESARLVLTVATDLAFQYDPTYDAHTTFTTADDGDGRPIELYGAAFRNGWMPCAINESVPALNAFPCFYEGTSMNPGPDFSPGGNPNEGVRNAFATDFAARTPRDISNNIRDAFDPVPFAIGLISAVTPGALVPIDSEVIFDLDTVNPDAQAFLRAACDSGLLRLMLSSLQPASSSGGPGSGSFVTFSCKEDDPLFAARFTMAVRLIPAGDADGNGAVNFADVTATLTQWGGIGPDGDADCDGDVDFADITEILTNFGATE